MRIRITGLVIASIMLLLACSKVPVTNRKQVNMLPPSTMMSMSLTNYRDFLKKNPPAAQSDADAARVKRVGKRIQSAVNTYLKDHNQLKRVKNFKWEFNVVNNRTVNAWCMPGGKVVVYSGIMPIAKDEDGLAVVMGHEIAHAIARHGNERMSQQLLLIAGGVGIAVAMRDKPKETQNIFLLSYGVGGVLGVLAYSRSHEAEADRMGLVFMSMAGYDPDAAVDFWKRMSKEGGSGMPQFLSTHPADEKRIKNIEKYLPEARIYYRNSKRKP